MRSLVFVLLMNLSAVVFSNAVVVKDFKNHEIAFDKSGQGYKYKKSKIFELGHVKSYVLNVEDMSSQVYIEGSGQTAIFLNSQLRQISNLPYKFELKKSNSLLNLQFYPLQEELKVTDIKSSIIHDYKEYQRRFYPIKRSLLSATLVSEVGIFVFVLLVLLAYVFPDVFRSLFNLRGAIGEVNNASDTSSSYNVYLLSVLAFVQSSLVAFILVNYFFPSDERVLLKFTGLTSFIFLFLQFKRFLTFGFGYLFRVKKWVKMYYFESTKSLLYFCLVIFVFYGITSGNIPFLNIILPVVILIIWLLKSFVKIKQVSSISVLRNISYLCASEIIPLTIAYSIVLDFFIEV